MRTVRLLFCLAYASLLTVLLLAPHPSEVVGLCTIPTFPWGDIGIHFTAFTILTLLVHSLRWPARVRWPIVAALLAYGILTESLQVFVPSRSVELLDYTENLLGVVAGTGSYWFVGRLIQQRPADSRSVAKRTRHPTAAEATAE